MDSAHTQLQALPNAVDQLDSLQPVTILAGLVVANVLHALPESLFRVVLRRDRGEPRWGPNWLALFRGRTAVSCAWRFGRLRCHGALLQRAAAKWQGAGAERETCFARESSDGGSAEACASLSSDVLLLDAGQDVGFVAGNAGRVLLRWAHEAGAAESGRC